MVDKPQIKNVQLPNRNRDWASIRLKDDTGVFWLELTPENPSKCDECNRWNMYHAFFPEPEYNTDEHITICEDCFDTLKHGTYLRLLLAKYKLEI